MIQTIIKFDQLQQVKTGFEKKKKKEKSYRGKEKQRLNDRRTDGQTDRQKDKLDQIWTNREMLFSLVSTVNCRCGLERRQ